MASRRHHLAIYGTALLALVLKTQGAFWDVSYHFRHLRELTQSPHLLNGVGNIMLIVLTAVLWRRTPAHERGPLRWMTGGILLFLFAIPIDDRWHRMFGIDLEIWSPPHLLLYAGTALMMIGIMLMVQRDEDLGRLSHKARNVLLIFLFALLFDCVWFLLLQHEHGAVVGWLMTQGLYHPDADILRMHAEGKGRIFGYLPGLGYPMWGAFCMGATAGFLQALQIRWAMTSAMALYLLGRLLSYAFLLSVSYDVPTLPLFLVPCALCFELACNPDERPSMLRAAHLAALLVAPMYLWTFLPLSTPFIPAFHLASFPIAVLAAWLGLELAHAAIQRKDDLGQLKGTIVGYLSR